MAIIAPAVPFGFDSGLPDTEDELFPLSLLEEMTTDTQLGHLLECWDLESPSDTYSACSFAASDAIKSPGGQSQQHSNAGLSSRSPGSASLILTPTSTIPDSFGDATGIEGHERNNLFRSPETSTSCWDDYVLVDHSNDQAEIERSMENRPPTVSASGLVFPVSGVSSSPLHQTLGHGAPTSVPRQHTQWQHPSSSTNATGAWMDPQHAGRSGQLNMDAGFTFDDGSGMTTQTLTGHLISRYATLPRADNELLFDAKLPFQALDHETHLPCHYSHYPQANVLPQCAPGQVVTYPHTMYQQPLPQDFYAASNQQTFQAVNRPTPSNTTFHQHYTQLPLLEPQVQQAQVRRQQPHQPNVQVRVPFTVVNATRTLLPTIPGSSNTAAHVPNDLRRRRGGRQRGDRLNEGARGRSHRMRQAGACWRCVLQRDPCPDDGSPCKRCLDSQTKARLPYFFACDRTKLGDLVYDFLPPTMTLMHTKQTIEDCVKDQVARWDMTRSIDVELTSGYGPPLRWKLYEFEPRTAELLGQFQYRQDPFTGVLHRFQKYSPPLGLMKLDTSDDAHFETYMDLLLDPQLLADEFGYTCYEEETPISDFQAQLLDLMCALYAQTQELDELHVLLRSILRMLLLTYIMSHTLTLDENTAPSVLSAINRSPTPPAHMLAPHTSPRLANRQLKFFFSILRNQVYEQLLRWQQQTLHASTPKKEVTWLSAFCVMLGFAMVLEEVQRTIYIQADTKAAKGETTVQMAMAEAENACERIDKRFALMVGLFQCKYRDKKWGARGSFGNQTPELVDLGEVEFLATVYQLVVDKQDHLKSRKDVALAPENQCQFTTRLVSRFLLPFLGLPP